MIAGHPWWFWVALAVAIGAALYLGKGLGEAITAEA